MRYRSYLPQIKLWSCEHYQSLGLRVADILKVKKIWPELQKNWTRVEILKEFM